MALTLIVSKCWAPVRTRSVEREIEVSCPCEEVLFVSLHITKYTEYFSVFPTKKDRMLITQNSKPCNAEGLGIRPKQIRIQS